MEHKCPIFATLHKEVCNRAFAEISDWDGSS